MLVPVGNVASPTPWILNSISSHAARRIIDYLQAMTQRIDPGDFRPSSLSEGRCFVYVLPCVIEDLLKLGFSRDPVGRLQTLHRRYFELFDLERAFLIETETVREARRLELALRRQLPLHNAPAPLVIRREAAGHTEWYRGAYAHLIQEGQELSIRGYRLHQPLRPWLRRQLIERSDRLFSWASDMLAAMDLDAYSGEPMGPLACTLRDAFDAIAALQIDLEPLVSGDVLRWHRSIWGVH